MIYYNCTVIAMIKVFLYENEKLYLPVISINGLQLYKCSFNDSIMGCQQIWITFTQCASDKLFPPSSNLSIASHLMRCSLKITADLHAVWSCVLCKLCWNGSLEGAVNQESRVRASVGDLLPLEGFKSDVTLTVAYNSSRITTLDKG